MDNTMLISAMTMLLIVTMGGFTWQIIRAIGEATMIMAELFERLDRSQWNEYAKIRMEDRKDENA